MGKNISIGTIFKISAKESGVVKQVPITDSPMLSLLIVIITIAAITKTVVKL
jgi:hypothetical protein